MEAFGFLTFLFMAAFFWLIFAQILHKAGFTGWFALLLPLTGFVGLAIFSFIEWPIQQELAWMRLKGGMPSPELIPTVERYALALERRGEWKQAAEVYEALSHTPSLDDNAEYYRNCVERLKERLGI
ncbi:MAG: hypothetical protein ACLQGP_35575 [Isosphaeraceae bacterium]